MHLSLIRTSILLALSALLLQPARAASDDARAARWQVALDFIANSPPAARIGLVNQFINTFEYRTDAAASGKKDEWISPAEFVRRGAGDCEDFAFAKYQALLDLGVNESRLRLAYVRRHRATNWDAGEAAASARAASSHEAHMVLLVMGQDREDPNQALVLDNASDTVEPLRYRTEYEPVFAFNRLARWQFSRHESPEPLPPAVSHLMDQMFDAASTLLH